MNQKITRIEVAASIPADIPPYWSAWINRGRSSRPHYNLTKASIDRLHRAQFALMARKGKKQA